MPGLPYLGLFRTRLVLMMLLVIPVVVVVTSSRQAPDLAKSYELWGIAYVVKPIDFQQFVNTVKELGLFWTVINEPPPGSLRKTP